MTIITTEKELKWCFFCNDYRVDSLLATKRIYQDKGRRQAKVAYELNTDIRGTYYMIYSLDAPFFFASRHWEWANNFSEEAYKQSDLVCSVNDKSVALFDGISELKKGTKATVLYALASGLLGNNLADFGPDELIDAEQIAKTTERGLMGKVGNYEHDMLMRSQQQGSWVVDPDIGEDVLQYMVEKGLLEKVAGGHTSTLKAKTFYALRHLKR